MAIEFKEKKAASSKKKKKKNILPISIILSLE
jgi:hypothetical protein